jgi:hypothetical protein
MACRFNGAQMKRIYRYNKDGELTGYSERPPTAAEAKADLRFSLLMLGVAAVAVIFAPLIYPFFVLNSSIVERMDWEWHPSLRLLIFTAANVLLLLAVFVVFLLTPRRVLRVAGAMVYGLYGFGLIACLTANQNSKWSIKAQVPLHAGNLPEILRDGDLIWSVIALTAAAVLGWHLFDFIGRKLQ